MSTLANSVDSDEMSNYAKEFISIQRVEEFSLINMLLAHSSK